MAAAIRDRHDDAEVELIRGSGGVFDVVVENDRVFSKHEVGRFPEHSEVLERLRGRAE